MRRRWLGRASRSVSNRSQERDSWRWCRSYSSALARAPRQRCCSRPSRRARCCRSLLFYLAPLPILIAALGWSHLAGTGRGADRGGARSCGVFGTVLFLAFLARRRPAGLVARLPRPAGAPGRDRRRRDDARMVSGRPPGGLGGAARRARRHRRDPEFRPRCRELPRRSLRTRLRAHAAGAAGTAGGRRRVIPGVTDAEPADRPPGGAIPPAAAVLVDAHQPDQSVARRAHRAVVRPAHAAVAGPFGADVPALRCRRLLAARRARHRSCPASARHRIRRCSSQACSWPTRVLGLAVLHAITLRHRTAAASCSAAPTCAMFVFGWPVLMMALLGLAEAALDFRGRDRAQARRRLHLMTSINQTSTSDKEKRRWK